MVSFPINDVVNTDALSFCKTLPDECVNCIVTSPPYFGLRDYGVDGQLGLEETPEAYVSALVEVFREARRVLRSDGTFWLNLGDTYTGGGRGANPPLSRHWKQGTNTGSLIANRTDVDGLPAKSLVGIPWRVAFALQADGWILRSDIIWHKPNCMPESVTDRPTKAHEYLFLLTKTADYFYDNNAIREPQTESSVERAKYGWNGRTEDNSNGARTGSSFKRMAETGEPIATIPADGYRNKRSVWNVPTQSFTGAHFATFPPQLIEPMILAGCPKDGLVYDPFFGAGTVGLVAQQHGRNWIGSEINPEYCELARARINGGFEQYQAEKAGLPYMQSLFD